MTVFSADEIERIVYELSDLRKVASREQIDANEEYTNFRTSNRIFYEMIICGDIETPENKTIFKEMLKMKRKLEAGEDQYSVDTKLGQFMAKKYIDPVTEKLK
jgi:hypothetical protein